jgi:hypothetical protein
MGLTGKREAKMSSKVSSLKARIMTIMKEEQSRISEYVRNVYHAAALHKNPGEGSQTLRQSQITASCEG